MTFHPQHVRALTVSTGHSMKIWISFKTHSFPFAAPQVERNRNSHLGKTLCKVNSTSGSSMAGWLGGRMIVIKCSYLKLFSLFCPSGNINFSCWQRSNVNNATQVSSTFCYGLWPRNHIELELLQIFGKQLEYPVAPRRSHLTLISFNKTMTARPNDEILAFMAISCNPFVLT